jgi:hypothetical protein
MPKRTGKTGSELFIVDNSDANWKVLRYLHDLRQLSKAIDVARTQLKIRNYYGKKRRRRGFQPRKS